MKEEFNVENINSVSHESAQNYPKLWKPIQEKIQKYVQNQQNKILVKNSVHVVFFEFENYDVV